MHSLSQWDPQKYIHGVPLQPSVMASKRGMKEKGREKGGGRDGGRKGRRMSGEGWRREGGGGVRDGGRDGGGRRERERKGGRDEGERRGGQREGRKDRGGNEERFKKASYKYAVVTENLKITISNLATDLSWLAFAMFCIASIYNVRKE